MNPKKQWAREDNLNELLSLLRQHRELSFSDLRDKLKVSEPTLTEYIVKLEKDQQIEAFFKPEDRRKKWYRIKPQSNEEVEARLGKYEATRFIEGIPNPVHVFRKKESKAVAVFCSVPNEQERDAIKKAVEITASLLLKSILLKPLKDKRIAIVQMALGGDKAE